MDYGIVTQTTELVEMTFRVVPLIENMHLRALKQELKMKNILCRFCNQNICVFLDEYQKQGLVGPTKSIRFNNYGYEGLIYNYKTILNTNRFIRWHEETEHPFELSVLRHMDR